MDQAIDLYTKNRLGNLGVGPGQWIGSEIRQAWLDKHLKDL